MRNLQRFLRVSGFKRKILHVFFGCAVVVATFCDEILDDFSFFFFSECVFFQMKINNQFWVSLFFIGKVAIFIGRETNTHFTNENQRNKFANVSSSDGQLFF